MFTIKNILIVVILLLVVVAGKFLFFTSYEIKNYPPSLEGPVVAFGDSLVEGVGSSSGGGFVSLLSEMTGEKIINLGVSGDTTREGLLRLNEVLETKPKVVIVLLGGNDFIKKIPKEETFNNLRTIINSIQSDGAVVVLLGVRGGVLTDSYEDSFKELARETGSAYLPDVLDGVFGRQSLMSDTIHPNQDGYQIIAEKIYPVLDEVAY